MSRPMSMELGVCLLHQITRLVSKFGVEPCDCQECRRFLNVKESTPNVKRLKESGQQPMSDVQSDDFMDVKVEEANCDGVLTAISICEASQDIVENSSTPAAELLENSLSDTVENGPKSRRKSQFVKCHQCCTIFTDRDLLKSHYTKQYWKKGGKWFAAIHCPNKLLADAKHKEAGQKESRAAVRKKRDDDDSYVGFVEDSTSTRSNPTRACRLKAKPTEDQNESDTEAGRFECRQCHAILPNEQQLLVHTRGVHRRLAKQKRRKLLTCQYCPRTFIHHGPFDLHRKYHDNEITIDDVLEPSTGQTEDEILNSGPWVSLNKMLAEKNWSIPQFSLAVSANVQPSILNKPACQVKVVPIVDVSDSDSE